MKKITTLFLLVVTVLFTSCDSKKGRDFNDKLVNIQKDVLEKYQAIMKGANETENMKKAKDYVDLKVAELKKVESVSGGEAFKQAMIDDIGFLGKISEIGLKLLNPDISETEATALNNEKSEWMNKATKLDNDVIDEQRKFAKDKGFKLENK